MELPLTLSANMGHGAEMIAAVATGFGFGFVLERAGFGRADNLASIFYGRDFRVMRVMFTAIVTAMIGLYFLDLVGVMPLGNVGLLPTYLAPQLAGGLLLGVGFIVGGYCPGTSLVAVTGGKIDAMIFVAGIITGSAVFTVGYDTVAAFHQSPGWGRVLLHEQFHVSSGVMVLVVALFAAGAFWAVGRIEALVNRSLRGAS
jgi:uncharacterized protein